MKVKIDAKELHEVLKVFAVVVKKSSTISVLTYLKIEVAENRLVLSGTDLETSLKCELPAEVIDRTGQAVCLVPFHRFKQYVSKTKGSLHLKLDLEEFVVGNAVFHELPDVEDFPVFPDFPEGLPLSFESEDLVEALSFCLPCVATEESRFILSGVYFELPCINEPPLAIDHPVARLVATDGHRLAMVETDFRGSIEGRLEAIVPKVGLTALLKVLKRTDGSVSLNCNDGHLYVRTGTWEIGIKLIEGQFPDYRAVFPRKGLRAIFDAQEMFEALEELKTLSAERYAPVKCTFGDDRIEILLQQEDSGAKTFTCQYQGPRVSLQFNARYLIDALKGQSGRVIFSFVNSSNTPAVLQFGNYPRKVALVMPMAPEDVDKTESPEIPAKALSPLPTVNDLEQYRIEVKARKRVRKSRGCATCRKLREENKKLQEQIEFLQTELQKVHFELKGQDNAVEAHATEAELFRKRIAELKAENEKLLRALNETEKRRRELDEIRARQERELQLVREELRVLGEQRNEECPTIPLQRLPEGGAIASVDGMVVYFRDGRILRPNGNGGDPIGRYDKLLGLGKIGDRVIRLKSDGDRWVLEILK